MIDRSLTYSLASIAEDGIGAANQVFVAKFGWSVRELRVLRLIRSSPDITFTVLAQRTKLERSLTSRTLTRLMRAGLIERVGRAEDARTYALRITEQGQALCKAADPLTAEFETLMLEPLSEAERKAFITMVEKVRSWVQDGYAAEVTGRHPSAKGRGRRGTPSAS